MLVKKKKIAVLGSTGSIGQTSLKIIEKYNHLFSVDLLCCNKNLKLLIKQIKKFNPKYVIINNINAFNFLKKKKLKNKFKLFNNLKNFNTYFNNKKKFDKVILGISSLSGLEYGFSFINYSNEILIANKETIVCGGKFFLNKSKKKKCKITSIDSEHYCLSRILSYINTEEINSVYLTASGGPFLNKRVKEIYKIDPKHALKHPKWKMGKKISIDSATMANKSLEVMEASFLFNLDPNKIKIKIHKESQVHSAVILNNGLVYLVAHNTSMSIPIMNSLLDNNNFIFKNNFFKKRKLFNFSFDEVNLKKFSILSSAYKALDHGERACIFFNVINDILVDLYLNKQIFYYQIATKLNKILNNKNLIKFYKKKITNIDDIFQTITYAKKNWKNF